MYEPEAPFCIQIEPTEGCNLYCDFCGLQGIRTKKEKNYKFMSLETAEELAMQLKAAEWSSRLEFAMHGEPTMNPHLAEMLGIFRKHLPKTNQMVTSNGGGLLKGDITENINAILEHANVLAIDAYEYVNIADMIREKYEGPYLKWEYPEMGPNFSPHRRRGPNEAHEIIMIKDISVSKAGTHSTLNNHSGAAFPKNDKAQGKRCAKPFREIAVRWDGSVAVCCNDWRGELCIGNVNDRTIRALWISKLMMAVRKKLYHGQRDFGPCQGCDAVSYRTGFLPDKKGNEELEEPNGFDLALIEQALEQQPLTDPVLRPWELTIGETNEEVL